MTKSVTLGMVQMAMSMNQEGNLNRALTMVDRAAKLGANIVCLPELFEFRYFPQDRESATATPLAIPNDTTDRLSEAARSNGIVLVGGSMYEKSGNNSYNTSPVFDEKGKLLGTYRKVHIPQDPCFFEQDYFSSGKRYRVFPTKYGRVGVLICFDQWYPEPARILKLMGADIIVYPTAIGTVSGVEQSEGDWRDAWAAVQRGHAISNSVIVAAANRTGAEGSMNFWGGSFAFDQFGKVLAQADEREAVLIAACDLDLAREVEDGWGFLRNRKPQTYKGKLGS